MPYATDARLQVLIPDTTSVAEAIRTSVLALTADMIDADVFGLKAELAHAFLTAHFIATLTGELGGASSNVTARSMGEVSISYGSGPPAESELAMTKWGRSYLTILRTVPLGPLSCFA